MPALMSLIDPNYPDELALRKRCAALSGRLHRAVPELARRSAKRRWRWAVAGIGAIVLAALVLPAMSSRCDLPAWQREPVTCWRHSWAALGERVSGNMAESRGLPVVIVPSGH